MPGISRLVDIHGIPFFDAVPQHRHLVGHVFELLDALKRQQQRGGDDRGGEKGFVLDHPDQRGPRDSVFPSLCQARRYVEGNRLSFLTSLLG